MALRLSRISKRSSIIRQTLGHKKGVFCAFVLISFAICATWILLTRILFSPSDHPFLFSPSDHPFPFTDLKIYSDVKHVCQSKQSRSIYPDTGKHSICYSDTRKTILIIQLTNWTYLDSCGVISAAMKNPSYRVCVLQPETVSLTERILKQWSRFNNIHVNTLQPTKILDGTSMLDWYKAICHNPTGHKFLIAQLSDALRWAYLYKHGGVSVDTDTLTLKSFDDLSNTIAWNENFHSVPLLNNAVLVFDRGHELLAQVIRSFPAFVKPDVWGTSSYLLLTHVYEDYKRRLEKAGVKDIQVNAVPGHVFYPFAPVHGKNPIHYLASFYEQVANSARHSYTFHLYRSAFTAYSKGELKPDKESYVGRFLQQYCT